jgi:hypothetical protein
MPAGLFVFEEEDLRRRTKRTNIGKLPPERGNLLPAYRKYVK